jgi:hypothetical protein
MVVGCNRLDAMAGRRLNTGSSIMYRFNDVSGVGWMLSVEISVELNTVSVGCHVS